MTLSVIVIRLRNNLPLVISLSANIGAHQLEKLEKSHQIADLYSATSMQAGMSFHSQMSQARACMLLKWY